ncbi:MAG: hypothetical protein KF777_18160 [Planctomycetaceae bacterium]|nr:hypothetical protein [Planctomycetaceae bacterium]
MFSFDPIAAALAVSALWIAYLAYRASCRIWVRLLVVDGAFSSSIYEADHSYLDVVIQNLGLPLHQARISLFFKDRDGRNYALGMQRVEYASRHKVVSDNGEFAQGMIGVFRLKSTILAKDGGYGIQMLKKLECPKQCDARIQVYSQDFLVAEFRLWKRFYWVKSTWNRFVTRVNQSFDRTVKAADGTIYLKPGKVLPEFNVNSQWRLECFVRDTVSLSPSLAQESNGEAS